MFNSSVSPFIKDTINLIVHIYFIYLLFFLETIFSFCLLSTCTTYASTGRPCRSSTRHARCPAASTTSQGASLSHGWPFMRAASPRSRAASTSGTPWPTWRAHGPTRPPCLWTGEALPPDSCMIGCFLKTPEMKLAPRRDIYLNVVAHQAHAAKNDFDLLMGP